MGLTQQMEQGSQSTFQVLDQVVQAFGGLAQMLDSTFHATYSSFMAMVGVVEQFGMLRDYLSRALSLAALYSFVRRLVAWVTGRPAPVPVEQLSAAAFDRFAAGAPDAAGAPPASRKPLIVFVAIVAGLLALAVRRGREHAEQVAVAAAAAGTTTSAAPGSAGAQLPPAAERARALFDFAGQNAVELSFNRGDVIDVISRTTSKGQPAPWWKGRLPTNPSRVGLFPGNHVELVAAAGALELSPEDFVAN